MSDPRRYYLVHEFIIQPKKSHKSARPKTAESRTPGFTTPAVISPPQSESDSGSDTPPDTVLPGTDTTSPSKSSKPKELSVNDVAAQALGSLRSPKTRKDGGVVAGIAVHELCMKIGRMTVPPVSRVVLLLLFALLMAAANRTSSSWTLVGTRRQV